MTVETRQRSRDEPADRYDAGVDEVVEGRVMRITGAGKFIVYPVDARGRDVKVGDPARIVIPGKLLHDIMLETREDRISTPIASNWAIIVSGRQSVERCRVFYNSVQLNAIDHMGQARAELRLPRDGSLTFRIPDYMEINDAFLVEVRDGEVLLRGEPFGAIRRLRAPPPKI